MLYDNPTAGQVTVLWQPDSDASYEPLMSCDGAGDDEAAILADFLQEAPAGASARVERRAGGWYIIASEPAEIPQAAAA